MALQRDESHRVWVAREPEDVAQALAHPLLLVRPPDEPVPRALLGTPAGDVFALLVRMNDGEFHTRHRPAVDAAAGRFDFASVGASARIAARDCWERVDANEWLWRVPVQAMARMLDVAPSQLDTTVDDVGRFVRAIAPAADADAIERGSAAALRLMAQGESRGLDRVRAANRIALMQQSLDATSGWLGNTLAALQRGTSDVTRAFVDEVALREPAVLNTRRFAAQATQLAGASLQRGDAVLVMIGEAGFGFGAGAHRCPGERIAAEIVFAAIDAVDWRRRDWTPLGYRPLANAQVPVFAA